MALHFNHANLLNPANVDGSCLCIRAPACVVHVFGFGAVHIWCGLELGPCWCSLMVLKTDTEHTKHTAACSPLTCGLYTDKRVLKVAF